MTDLLINKTESPSQLGSRSENISNKERKVVANLPPFHRNWSRVPNHVNDNYCAQCVTGLKDFVCVPGQLGLNPSRVVAKDKKLSSKSETVNLLVNSCVANVHSVTGLPQKKGVNPTYCHKYTEIKYVKDVSCVGHLSSANLVTNVTTVALDPPVGAQLHQFWEKWETLGSSPKVVTALREGTPFPSGANYANPQRQSHLLEALYQLINKNAVELVANQNSLGFYNSLFLVPEKQVHLGRLHMRPIQWHLKNNWRVPEPLEKVISVPRSLHPHLRWWLEESNVLTGQPLHPLKHALQIFTDASKEGWGAHLNERTARGTWSLPESKLHISHLELKVVFLALKEFQDLCCNNTVLVPTNNTTVVAYINKERGMKLGSLCAVLWELLKEKMIHRIILGKNQCK